jgi:Na+-translocating ferredoxin:NAD+ oxidoreductase RnfG subunit/NAD-dependent dihydropyrimidine dehydrogenase PreA subunit
MLPPRPRLPGLLLLGLALLLAPSSAAAQGGLSREFFEWVLPHATEYSPEKEGNPPVFRGYTVDEAGNRTLVGFAFFTSDVPPEELGYNGPIEVLVGMDLTGTLTGVVVTHYNESLQQTRGDFLFRRGFQEQFTGKSIRDAFRVRRDVDGISGATITVDAMAMGIRNAARRVAAVYLAPPDPAAAGWVTPDEMARLSWQELVSRGLVAQVRLTSRGMAAMEVSLAPIPSAEVGGALLGDSLFLATQERLGGEADSRDLYLLGVDGGFAELFPPQALSLVKGDDTTRIATADAVMLGAPRRGGVDGQFRQVGMLRVGGPFDPHRAFTLLLDLRPGMELSTAEHRGWAGMQSAGFPRVVAAAETPRPTAEGVPGSARAASPGPATGMGGGEPTRDSAGALPPAGALAPSADSSRVPSATPPASTMAGPDGSPSLPGEPDTGGTAPAGVPGVAGSPADPGLEAAGPFPEAAGGEAGDTGNLDASWLQFDDDEEESALARTLAGTSWLRFGLLAALLTLTVVAFLSKAPGLRVVTLVSTVLLLGFSGGFLSVSHITSALKVGPGVFLNDLPLLLLVLFTGVTTLLWGRIFCGFLCPFGALQDALERIVPRRFRKELPAWLHRRAVLGKYGILGLVVVPVLLGSQASLFQYFEPFGTVFFFSSSLLLWAIAGTFLAASAVIPRFYCRYACPLGAALALGSMAAPFRIQRVEQCTVCRVCENACPTGAIQKERVDFRECVRCNVCEKKLMDRAGVCRHEMGEVRSRLVQIRTPSGVGGD